MCKLESSPAIAIILSGNAALLLFFILITDSDDKFAIHSGSFCRLGLSGKDKNCNLVKLHIVSGIEATQPTK